MNEVEKLFEAICDNYCKYPDIYNEDREEIPLSESEICTNCPVTYMLGVYHDGKRKTSM